MSLDILVQRSSKLTLDELSRLLGVSRSTAARWRIGVAPAYVLGFMGGLAEKKFTVEDWERWTTRPATLDRLQRQASGEEGKAERREEPTMTRAAAERVMAENEAWYAAYRAEQAREAAERKARADAEDEAAYRRAMGEGGPGK